MENNDIEFSSCLSEYEMTVPIVFATNEAYAPHAGVCIRSLLDNGSRDVFYDVRILHTGLSEKTQKMLHDICEPNVSVKCMDVSEVLGEFGDKLYEKEYFSKEMYYRFIIPEIMCEYERVIYLDCDMIVLGDISELLKFDMHDCYVAGCRNFMHSKMRSYVSDELGLDPRNYINSGMLVFDIRACREFKLLDRMFAEIVLHDSLRYPDQDLINILLSGKIFYLPAEWNYLWHLERLESSQKEELRLLPSDREEFYAAKPRTKILHYTGDQKPWYFNAISGADKFWVYAERSNFYSLIRKKFIDKNKSLQKIKLVFLDIRGEQIELTCSYDVLFNDNKDSYLYLINNDIFRPRIYAKRSTSAKNVRLTQRLFTIKIPIKTIFSSCVKLCFTVNSKSVLFEYEKFFPLNGCSNSYFAGGGILIYRKGKELFIERCTRRKRITREKKYLAQLLGSDDKIKKKSVFMRLLYFFTKPFMSKNIWLISDRPTVAGDNGEALFKYINSSRELSGRIKAYFVISKEAADYKRLSKCGRVVRLSSFKHKLLALHASVKAVSQTDRELYEPIARNYVKDLKYRETRVFLQHGITKDDISRLYSRFTHGFNMFVTAAYPEYKSIVGNSAYGCDSRITKLTGFPRHDLLHNAKGKTVVIAPTWRRELDADLGGDDAKFVGSEYYAVWHSLVAESRFTAMCKKRGYRILLLLHNKMRPYMKHFSDISTNVRIADEGESFCSIFSNSALLITDYSSNSFEFSYLGKPVIYYQYDADTFFAKHTYDKGYFDYKKDGFGDVVKNENELLASLGKFFARGGKTEKKYKERMTKFFAFSDDKNSERVVREILKKAEAAKKY